MSENNHSVETGVWDGLAEMPEAEAKQAMIDAITICEQEVMEGADDE